MLKDIIYYILAKHTNTTTFSNARITKLIYLSDWKSCLERGHQITNIEWFFDYYWPFVRDIENEIDKNPDLFIVEAMANGVFGGNRKIFAIKNDNYTPSVSEEEQKYINFVIEKTSSMWFSEFIKYVYSTYPIYKSRKFEKLDLSSLATEYKQLS